MPTSRIHRLSFVVALAVLSSRTLSGQGTTIDIAIERVTLPNGLEVILAPNHSIPQVTVDIWYHVGSKNEVPGHTGFAHMGEHVMFTGSAHVPYGLHDRLTEGVSGIANNGSTTNDATNYYETVPPNYLESVLWIESDRMGFLLDKLDSAKFAAQRDIVQNERRQRTDNVPYGRAIEITTVAMLPESNPYSWPVVGYLSELQKATVDDVKNFFRQYYAPSNATIAIVGDFQPAQTKAWITKYFADLPRGRPIVRPTVPRTTLTSEKRLVYEDRVQVPRLYVRWPSVGVTSDDDIALQFMGSILSGSRTTRLTKALVYDRQSAASVQAGQNDSESIGDFVLILTPRPGHTLAELEAQTDSVLETFKREGPTLAELQRAQAGLEYSFVRGLESNLGKADNLDEGLVFHNDPKYFQTQYKRVKSLTPADVKRVANTYLTPGRVVLSVVPIGKIDQASAPGSSTRVTVSADGGHYIMDTKGK